MPRSRRLAVLLALLVPLACGGAAAGEPDFDKIFKGKDGCFLLFDAQAGKAVVEYNPKRCAERVSACSTFKIPLAVMAFDQGLLKDETTAIKWDGIDRKNRDWNQDQTPKTWLKYSTVWVSQRLAPRLGAAKIAKYLADFRYGNQDMSGGLTKAWLSSTLKISAEEQIDFLRRLWSGKVSASPRAVALVKSSIDTERSERGAELSGKTGSGVMDDRRSRLGWFVGRLESGGHEYFLAVDFSDAGRRGQAGLEAREIVRDVLRSKGLF